MFTKITEIAPDGERLDGVVEISPDHPKHAEWLQAINNREQYSPEFRQAQMLAREQRRAASEEKNSQQEATVGIISKSGFPIPCWFTAPGYAWPQFDKTAAFANYLILVVLVLALFLIIRRVAKAQTRIKN